MRIVNTRNLELSFFEFFNFLGCRKKERKKERKKKLKIMENEFSFLKKKRRKTEE